MNRRNFLQTSRLLAAGGAIVPQAAWLQMLLPPSGTYTVVRRNVGMYVNCTGVSGRGHRVRAECRLGGAGRVTPVF